MLLRVCRRLCSVLGPGGGLGVGHGGVSLFTSYYSGYFWEHLSATGGALLSDHCACSAGKRKVRWGRAGPVQCRRLNARECREFLAHFEMTKCLATASLLVDAIRSPAAGAASLHVVRHSYGCPCVHSRARPFGVHTPADHQQLLWLTFLLSVNTSHHLCPPSSAPARALTLFHRQPAPYAPGRGHPDTVAPAEKFSASRHNAGHHNTAVPRGKPIELPGLALAARRPRDLTMPRDCCVRRLRRPDEAC
jgi:hypothetical protein